MITTVWPACSAFVTPTYGPAWYIGPHTRCTPAPTVMPKPWHVAAAVVAATSSGSPSGNGSSDALRLPGGARGVHHLLPGAAGRLRVRGPRCRSEKGRKSSTTPTAKRRSASRPASAAAGAAQVGEVLVAHQHLGVGVGDDERHLGGSEVGIHRHEVEPRLRRWRASTPGSSGGSAARRRRASPRRIPSACAARGRWRGTGRAARRSSGRAAVGVDDRHPLGIRGRDPPEPEVPAVQTRPHGKRAYCFPEWGTASATS